jgi:hypothetical protein
VLASIAIISGIALVILSGKSSGVQRRHNAFRIISPVSQETMIRHFSE